MNIRKYVRAAALITLSFGAGMKYQEIKYENMPYSVKENGGQYHILDKNADEEYDAKKLIGIYRRLMDLVREGKNE